MILYLLNESLEKIGIIDDYVSIIWTPRYQDVGDFELYLPSNNPNTFQTGQFIQRDDNDELMKIEDVQFNTDEEAGDYCIVSGKSIENILNSRIVWYETQLEGRVEESIYRLIDENIVNSEITDRNISRLYCAPLKGFTEKISFVCHGQTLLEIIKSLCQSYGYGFKITFSNEKLMFEVYKGIDRSYRQSENPYVIFSPDFDNLAQTTYVNNISNYKNVCLAHGKTANNANGFINQIVGSGSGFNRYETFVDGGEDKETNINDFIDQLNSAGIEELSEKIIDKTFDGEVQSTYVYGEDYYLGDIVYIENEYGIKAAVRIIEIIESEDESGYKCIPTFEEV